MSTKSSNRITSPRGVPYGGRSAAERRTYVANVVEGAGPSSTVPSTFSDTGNSTDSPLSEDVELRERTSTKRPPSRKRDGFWDKHRDDIGKAFISLVVVSFLGGAFYFALTTQREMGEVRTSVAGLTREVDQVRDRVTRSEERTERQLSNHAGVLEAIRQRLDELRGRFLGSSSDKKN